MRRILRCGVVLGVFLWAGKGVQGQATTNPSGQKIVVAGAPETRAVDTRKLTDKQRVLANEADQLLSMATELKAEVDMTSKNILSVKVVRTAEEIEQYAHILKDRAKK